MNVNLYRFIKFDVRLIELAVLAKYLFNIRRFNYAIGQSVFYIDPVSDFGFKLTSDQAYEPQTTESILALPGDGDAFVDLGASEGFFSAPASKAPIRVAADSWNEYFQERAVEPVRCVYPMLADVADYKRTIDHVATHSLKGTLLHYMERYKIFPVYQVLKRRRKKLRTAMLNFELLEQ